MYLRIPIYCDACLNSSALHVGVKTLLNTIKKYNTGKPEYVSSPVSTGGFLGAKPPQTKLQAPQIET